MYGVGILEREWEKGDLNASVPINEEGERR